MTIVNRGHLRVGVARVAEIVDVVGFVVGLVGMGAMATHLLMSAYLNPPHIVVG